MNERGKELGSRIIQANRDTGGKNNFDGMSRTINNFDGNEGRRIDGLFFCILMFLEPTMNSAGSTTNFSCDLRNGGEGISDSPNGLLLDFGTITNVGHDELKMKTNLLFNIDQYSKMQKTLFVERIHHICNFQEMDDQNDPVAQFEFQDVKSGPKSNGFYPTTQNFQFHPVRKRPRKHVAPASGRRIGQCPFDILWGSLHRVYPK